MKGKTLGNKSQVTSDTRWEQQKYLEILVQQEKRKLPNVVSEKLIVKLENSLKGLK